MSCCSSKLATNTSVPFVAPASLYLANQVPQFAQQCTTSFVLFPIYGTHIRQQHDNIIANPLKISKMIQERGFTEWHRPLQISVPSVLENHMQGNPQVQARLSIDQVVTPQWIAIALFRCVALQCEVFERLQLCFFHKFEEYMLELEFREWFPFECEDWSRAGGWHSYSVEFWGPCPMAVQRRRFYTHGQKSSRLRHGSTFTIAATSMVVWTLFILL